MSGMNHYRAAIACSKLTGTGYGRSAEMEEQGLISLYHPVPDASTADQRSFEALIAHVLANALRERQLGATLGVAAAFPGTDHITLRLHQAMASRVLWELLPRFDSEYACIRGVPAVRMEHKADRIILRDLLSQARVYVVLATDPRAMMHRLLPSERPLWTDGHTKLSEAEAAARASWTPAGTFRQYGQKTARDWLLSRVLRRPVLINRACRMHGWANTYTDEYEDLVIQSCCDEAPTALARQFRQSGVTTWPGIHLVAPGERVPVDGPAILRLGYARIILRRGDCARVSPLHALRISTRQEWYR